MAKDKKSELQHWKSTYRLQFAITLIASAVLCVHVLFPTILKVSFQGSIWEEAVFILLLWFVSSMIIGIITVVSSLYMVLQAVKRTDTSNGLDRAALATEMFTGNFMRWLMSLSPCVGPPLALAIMSNFYRSLLFFPDSTALAQGCALLAIVSFIVCLPLTIYAQQSLKARLEEKFAVNVADD